MHSKHYPPARRSPTFDDAATTGLLSVLRNMQKIGTLDDRRRDREIAIYVESSLLGRRDRITDLDREWDDGWLHGVALAARMMREQQQATYKQRARDAHRRLFGIGAR